MKIKFNGKIYEAGKEPKPQPMPTPRPNGYKELRKYLNKVFQKFSVDDICRAVNAYKKDQEIKDALVVAIREIDEDLTYFDGSQDDLILRIKFVVEQVIAKAEGL